MRLVFMTIFAAIAVWLFCLSFFTRTRHKTEKGKALADLLITGALASLANIAMAWSVSPSATVGGYCLYCITLDWLIYCATRFTISATEHQPKVHGLMTVYQVLLIFDSILLFADPFYNYAIGVNPVLFYGEQYYVPVYHLYYYIHLCLCYIPALVIVYTVVHKIHNTARTYWPKYTIILLIYASIYVWNGIYVLTGAPVDTSVIGYGLGATLLYYFTLNYVPKSLLHRVHQEIIDGFTDGVLFLDINGDCLYVNEAVKRQLDAEKVAPKDIPELLRKKVPVSDLMSLPTDEITTVSGSISVEDADENTEGMPLLSTTDEFYHLDFHCRDLKDSKMRTIGRLIQINDRTEEHKKIEEERYRASHDAMTGLYNRENFYHAAALEMSQHPDVRYVLLVSNVKNFKFVNDFFGNNTGDDVLKQLAYELQIQSLPGDIYGRLEADHFAMLLPQERFSEEPFVRASELIRIVEDLSYEVTLYFGVYMIEADDMSSVAAMCERCLLAIQTVGPNDPRIMRYYDVQMRLDAYWASQMAKDLDEGLRGEEFKLYVQPQVGVDESVQGGEVLVRWQHPRDGLLLPARFVPALEKNGSITRLDYYVWERTCQILQRWKKEGKEDWYLSVNISPIDFYFYDIYTIFTGLAREYGLDPKNLRLEITETAVIRDSESAFELLERLQKAGFIIEMDDFGSGYSSLNLLKDLPADALKVDMIFLQETRNEDRKWHIIRSVIQLAKSLQLEVITEGVETKEQADALKEMGTDYYQGFYFAKPMPLEDFEEKYMK